ncbi:LysE family translocator [Nocardioides sp. ChNu-153]|uniref:LysE family translocator n=1 Tax=unclassified Nocardioides TaxID=2615069 RepID=UPI002406B04F|nr:MULTISPECIES: LysE family translocator [unclassified Nocardioides]MDF9714665.1 LysE family translocator [Nocardioides sp. ChNu-99]MDN7119800.1 LysE family translocator [Nocardioides sp. ChNu-153]
MDLGTIGAFLLVATVAYVTPGPDWFVVMRHAATSRRAGLVAALGVQSGLVVHMTAAAVGVAAVLLASAEAFLVLKLVGAAYLVFLGARALRDSFRHRLAEAQADGGPTPATSSLAVWRQSFVANVLNPKAALFFVAVLPQFLSTSSAVAPQVLLLGTLDVALGLVWWAVFVAGVQRLRSALGARRSRLVVDRVSGVALIGLGGLLATVGRRS